MRRRLQRLQRLRCRRGRHAWVRDPLTTTDLWVWCPSCHALERAPIHPVTRTMRDHLEATAPRT